MRSPLLARDREPSEEEHPKPGDGPETALESAKNRDEPVEFLLTMSTVDLIAIIGSIFGSALALGVMMMRFAARIDADRRAFQAEAAQDRRALRASMDRADARMDSIRTCNQASMDRFQAEMQRFAERQSRVEAAREVRSLNPGAAG